MELYEEIEKRENAIKIIEMHTAGEPTRIVVKGYPPILGSNVLEKRRYVKDNLDWIRKRILFEPRGHKDQYGAIILGEKTNTEADVGVLFMHNAEGYSTMCGHATIALGRFLIDSDHFDPQPIPDASGRVTVKIECPCGIVPTFIHTYTTSSGQLRSNPNFPVSFQSVPSFSVAIDCVLEILVNGQHKNVKFDIGFGGAFYAIVAASELGFDNSCLDSNDLSLIVKAANDLSNRVRQSKYVGNIRHPSSEHSELNFLYGTIVTDGRDGSEDGGSRNLCVFADCEIDRSPCGSGVSARMALLYAKGILGIDKTCYYESVLGGDGFTGKVIREVAIGDVDE
ncbi:1184_t:CDS:2, partial [Paraglomus brasilianum]